MARGRGISRRQALALTWAGTLGLAGCDGGAGGTDGPGGPRSATGAGGTPGSGAVTAGTSGAGTLPPSGAGPLPSPSGASPTVSASALAGTTVTRAQIVQRYQGNVPKVWSLTTPGVVQRRATKQPLVALTFDACGGPTPRSAGCGYDRDLIELLRRHRARATLFLNRRWIAANPGIAAELFADPLFEIGNHGTRHLPLSVTGRSAYHERGTANPGEVYDEIVGNRDNLAALTGRVPGWFRPGTAFCDEVAVRIASDLGCRIAGFSVNGDAGTTFTRAQIGTALATARAGDIVISHMNRPEHQTAEGYRDALPRLLDRGLRPVTLSELIG